MTVRSLLALSAPLLMLLGLAGLLLRQGSDRLQALPALLIGGGLLLNSLWGWRRRRRALLLALRERGRDG
jgi:Na+/phosphate symporter